MDSELTLKLKELVTKSETLDFVAHQTCSDDYGARLLEIENEILQLYVDIKGRGYEWTLAMMNAPDNIMEYK